MCGVHTSASKIQMMTTVEDTFRHEMQIIVSVTARKVQFIEESFFLCACSVNGKGYTILYV